MAANDSKLKIGIIENTGPNTLLAFLQHAGSGASSIDIAAAFLTSSGVDSILYLLKKIAQKGSVRVLTGLYQGFTDPVALRKLYRIQEETKGRLQVSISRDSHFHWKCYFLKRSSSARLVVGSSNLTGDGLRQSGEFNLVLSVPTDSKPYRDVTALFETHWIKRAMLLTDSILVKYEEWKKSVGIEHLRPSIPIRKILGGSPASRQIKTSAPKSYWRYPIMGYCSEETVKVLNNKTNWEQRGYLYFSTWNRKFNLGDRVVLFDLSDNHKYVSIVEIKDTTEVPVKTPDGVHFAAFRVVRGIPKRRLVPTRWQFLKSDQLLKRQVDAMSIRKLSEGKFEQFIENLKKNAPK